MFPHDTAQYPVVFVNTQRRLDIFVHWILECVRYTAKDNVRIELDPIVLGHLIQLQVIALSELRTRFL